MPKLKQSFELISSLPSIWDTHRHLDADYLTSVKAGVTLAEDFGFGGVLLHYNLHAMEPWPMVAVVLAATRSLTPLIAAQPTNQFPHTTARLCMTAAALFRRRVDLNLIVGAKLEEQKSVGDTLPHDDKYERLREYGEVIRGILTAEGPYSHNGRWYQYDRFELSPSIDRELLPRMFVAGSSRAALLVAQSLADILVSHPPEADKFAEETIGALKQAVRPVGLAVRLGVIAREEREDAQIIALERFPQNRRGELATKLKTTAESTWIRSLAESSLKADPAQFSSVFWLGAYRSGKAYCPYLVGTYEEVAGALGQYHALGARVLLVDGPDTITDFEHLDRVLEQETSFPSCSQ